MNAYTRFSPADEGTVREFVEVIHQQAARAFLGVERPGLLQLVRIHPLSGDTVPQRFRIGDVDGMVRAAMHDASNGHNVYVEGRTVSEASTGRGKLADTRGVFAIIIDSDADKDKAAELVAIPSLIVETSPPANHHHGLSHAERAEESEGEEDLCRSHVWSNLWKSGLPPPAAR